MPRHFISYSSADALDFALRLHNELEAGPPSIPAWLDRRDGIQPGQDWDEAIAEALRTCTSLLFVMTRDSVEAESVCKREWTRALKYKKPIVPLKLHADAEMPFRLDPRQYIDFTRALDSDAEFNAALARLRKHLVWLASPAGDLQSLKDRLADAQRDLRRAPDASQQVRIRDEIEQLKKDVARQEEIVNNPQAAERRVEESIARGLERERQPERPVGGMQRSKFINPPPGIAPSYFQDRDMETGMLGSFLKDDASRLIVVIGRGGTGKTALVCRLLKSLEAGQLPDGDALAVDGIVYLSATGTRRVNTPNLYADLCKLLPDEAATQLDALYRNPQAGTEYKMQSLLSHFTEGRTVVLLDNFEDVVDAETHRVRDEELDEALRALLTLPHHTVKVILTTRIAPQDLAVIQPGRQRPLHLDEGLATPYAENILREMDTDGKVGLKDASDESLNEARERTRGYPRALEALFAILAADRDTTLPEILKDTENLLPENVVRDLVGEAFSRLDPAAQKVMQALAIYGHPVTPAAIDYLLQPHLPGIDSAPVLKRLVNMQFARREKEKGHYYLHPVDRAYALSLISRGHPSDRRARRRALYTQLALFHRAAEYFKQCRLPRKDWKTIEDLAPQFAEFDLRCEGEDYDTAASVLFEIGWQYLFRWSLYNQMAEMHERLEGHLSAPYLEERSAYRSGIAYLRMGKLQKAIDYGERALSFAHASSNKAQEGVCLGHLSSCYNTSGQIALAIDYAEQALSISRETGNRQNEAVNLYDLGSYVASLGQTVKAGTYLKQALAIAHEIQDRYVEAYIFCELAKLLIDEKDYPAAIKSALKAIRISKEINSPSTNTFGDLTLALAHFYLGDLAAARAAIEAIGMHDEPTFNHQVLVLLGLIAAKQSDLRTAREAFAEAVERAEMLLTHSPQSFRALDSKGLALCGLAVLGEAGRVGEAVEAYRAARAINRDAGVVGRVLRLFDALAQADAAGVLAGVRAAAAGEG